MKKINRPYKIMISLIVLCACCLFSAFAADISAVGYGDSIADAKANALGNLTSTIFGTNVFSGTLVTLDSQNEGSSTFSQSTTTLSYGNLISVQYSNGEKTSGSDKKLGSYKATATIPDSARDSYISKVKDSVTSVRSIYNQNAETMDLKKAKLSNLLNALSEYNNYRQVLISMGYSTSVPELGIPITFQSVYSEYESLLIEEENLLLQSSSTAATYAAQLQLQLLLEQNEKAQKELALQKENALAQANAMNLASINEQIQQAIENVVKTTTAVSSNDFTVCVNEIAQAISDYEAMCELYNSLLSGEFERIETEYEVNRAALEKKAYRVAELKIDGTPTSSALALREDELQELVDQRDQDKARVESLVSSNLRTGIQERYDLCLELMNSIQTKSFILDSRDDRASLVIGAYDGENFFWNCTVESDSFCVGDIHVGYELLTGQAPVTYVSGKKNKDEYNRYVNAQASYDAALRDNARLFDLSVQYHLTIDFEKGRYGFVVDGIRFISANSETILDSKEYSCTNEWYDSPLVIRDYGYSWLEKSTAEQVKVETSSTYSQGAYPLLPYESIYGNSSASVKYDDISTIPYAYTVGGFGGSLAGEMEFGIRANFGFGFVVDDDIYEIEDIFDVEGSVALDIVYYLSDFTYVGVSPAFSYRLYGDSSALGFHVMVDAGLYLEDIAAMGLRFGIGKTVYAGMYMRFLLPFIQELGFVPEFGIEYESSPNSIRTYFGAVIGF